MLKSRDPALRGVLYPSSRKAGGWSDSDAPLDVELANFFSGMEDMDTGEQKIGCLLELWEHLDRYFDHDREWFNGLVGKFNHNFDEKLVDPMHKGEVQFMVEPQLSSERGGSQLTNGEVEVRALWEKGLDKKS